MRVHSFCSCHDYLFWHRFLLYFKILKFLDRVYEKRTGTFSPYFRFFNISSNYLPSIYLWFLLDAKEL